MTIAAILLTITALFSYVNHRWIRLPTPIGVMLIALVVSLGVVLSTFVGFGLEDPAERFLNRIDFDELLLYGMLSFLLFAGALHIDLEALVERKWVIGSLATIGLVVSTLVVGTLVWLVLGWLGITLSWAYCLLFGALISPTDPIAVLSILRSARAPKSLEMKIAGESLFNDGVAVVLFLIILEIARGEAVTPGHVGLLLVQEAVGGGVLGLVLGFVAYRMLRSVDDYQVEILLTLALVTGGYALATALHLSGPITIVVAGLLVGNQGRLFAMSDETRKNLDLFWELVDEVLNAVLFVLIGLEVLILTFTERYLVAGLVVIPVVLLGRLLAVALPVTVARPFRDFTPGAIRILTWGGLRGGISVALALSLPASAEREVIVAITYAVVVFSILVQGLTIGRMVKSILG